MNKLKKKELFISPIILRGILNALFWECGGSNTYSIFSFSLKDLGCFDSICVNANCI